MGFYLEGNPVKFHCQMFQFQLRKGEIRKVILDANIAQKTYVLYI